MTNNGLPPLMLVSPNGQPTSVYIPTSNGTHPDGTPFADFSPEGPPIVDSDGSAYMEYEVRYVTYPPKVLQAVLYLLKISAEWFTLRHHPELYNGGHEPDAWSNHP